MECATIEVIYIHSSGKKQTFSIDSNTIALLPPEVRLKTAHKSDKKDTEGCALLSANTKSTSVKEKESEPLVLSQDIAKRLLFLWQCIPKLLKPVK